jgi:ABC-type transporter Mla subunit MlaD
VAEQERLLSLMLRAQHEALTQQAALLRPLIDGYQELAAGFASYAAQTVELVKIAQSAAEARAEASAAASAQNDQLSQMLASVASRMGIPTQ